MLRRADVAEALLEGAGVLLPKVKGHASAVVGGFSPRLKGEGAGVEEVLHRDLPLPARSEDDDVSPRLTAVVDGGLKISERSDEDLLGSLLLGDGEGPSAVGRREDDLSPRDELRRVFGGVVSQLGEGTADDVALGSDEGAEALPFELRFLGRRYGLDPLGPVSKRRYHRRRSSEDVDDDDDALSSVVERIQLGGRAEVDIHAWWDW